MEKIIALEFQIKHRPGKKNLNADALSRSKHLREPTKEEEDEQAEYIHSLHELGRKLTRENIIKEQKADETLKKVRKWIRNNRKPDKRKGNQTRKPDKRNREPGNKNRKPDNENRKPIKKS